MMYGFRKDGVAVKLPMGIYDTRDAAISFAVKNDYLAVIFDRKYLFTSNQSSFTKQFGPLRVLQTVPDDKDTKLFTDNDESIKDYPFYFKGLFGINSKNEIYTKLHTRMITTAFGNSFKIYLQGADVVFLSVDSPNNQSMRDVMNDVMQLAAETHCPGKQVGLRITPTSTGIFNMKQT